jgi:ribonuclease Y
MIQVLVAAFSGLIIGIFVGYQLRSIFIKNTLTTLKTNSKNAKLDAEREAANIIRVAEIQAKTAAIKARETFEAATREQKKQLVKEQEAITKREEILLAREQNLNSKADLINKKEAILDKRQNDLEKQNSEVKAREEKANSVAKEATEKLQKLARFTRDEAKTELFEEAKREIQEDIATLIKREKENLKESSEEFAREILIPAMQRYSGSHITDLMLRTVSFDDQTVKGKIIGREGRNIRALEAATGVNIIIDDAPNSVTVSSLSPERRELAGIVLEKLIAGGTITVQKIEEMVRDVTENFDKHLNDIGAKACAKANIVENDKQLLNKLGRLYFRTSFTQNVLQHSIEVANLAGMIATELHLDAGIARKVGLLHDIGKALDHEIQGPHAAIGADFLRKLNQPEEIVAGVAGHHGEIANVTRYAIIASIADAISSSRPGARSETTSLYLERVEKMEKIATSFKQTKNCYAVQAGREINVIVDPTETSDSQAMNLAKEIARRIQLELKYPGQIKVVVIRENRCIEYAK